MILQNTIIRNSIFNILGRVVFIICGIIITPYIILKIGIKSYGIWALLQVFTGYFILFDFGISDAYVKFIAEYNAKKDETSLNQVITSGFCINLALGVLILLIGLIFKNVIFKLFFKDIQITTEIEIIYILTLSIFCASYVLVVFQGLLKGFQQMHIFNNIAIFFRIISVILIFVFIKMGYGLLGLIISESIGTLLTLFFNIIYSKKIFKKLNLKFRYISISKLKKMFSFGVKLQITNLAIWVEQSVPKLILAHFTGITFVSFYNIGMKITKYVKEIPMCFYGAIVPAASELEAIKEEQKIKTLYIKGLKYTLLIIFPLSMFVFINSKYIIDMWVGPGFINSVFVLKVLALGGLVHLITGVGTAISRGIGKPELEMKYTILSSIFMVIFSLLLVKPYGLKGVAIGIAVSIAISSLYFFHVFHRYQTINNFEFFITILFLPIVVCIVLVAPIFFINNNIFEFGTTPRLTYFLILASQYFLYQSIVCGIMYKLKYVDFKEITAFFKQTLNRMVIAKGF